MTAATPEPRGRRRRASSRAGRDVALARYPGTPFRSRAGDAARLRRSARRSRSSSSCRSSGASHLAQDAAGDAGLRPLAGQPDLGVPRGRSPSFSFARYAANSFGPRGDGHLFERLPLLARRLRVRAPAVPGPRAAVHARPRDADDPRPAAARARLPDADDFPLFHWNLVGTYQGYILIKLVTATNLFLMRQYFLTIPRDFEEAAKLDGAGYFKTFWRVMLPLAGAGARGRRDPQLPGDVERLLLAADHPRFGIPTTTRCRRHRAVQFQYQTLWPQLMAASVIAIAADRDHLRLLPALLRRRRGLGGGEGMSSDCRRAAPRLACATRSRAVRDFYEQSWRLVAAERRCSRCRRARARRGGPFAARARARAPARPGCAGAHALRRDAARRRASSGSPTRSTGCALHWRRGLALGLLVTPASLAGAFAIAFYVAARGRVAARVSCCYLLAVFASAPAPPLAARGRRADAACARVLARTATALVRRPAPRSRLGARAARSSTCSASPRR